MHVAFVTYPLLPHLHADDSAIANYLSERNITVTAVSWDNPNADWTAFDVVVIRSTWDYFERPGEFDAWIEKIERLGCVVLNPLSVVRWNSNKRYFDAFCKMGFKLPPYETFDKGSNESLSAILKKNGWNKAVVKPIISGGAYHTWVTDILTAQSQEEQFQQLLQKRDLIVQKFIDDIITEGELSLIFFNKVFSHAIQKKPKAGDFRVQTQFGGTAVSINPSAHVMSVAKRLLESIEEPLLYARVDGVLTADGDFLLMELELIEPLLSVSSSADACENFYKGLLALTFEAQTQIKNRGEM